MAKATIDRVQVEITGESKGAEQAIDRTKSKLSGLGKFALKAGKAYTSAMVSPLKNMAEKFSRIGSRLKNIILYRLIRGAISKLIQSLDQGKKNIYAYDDALNGTSWSKASSLMQGMNANATILKDSFASLYMTILSSVKPAIDAMTDAIVNAVNAVNMLLSALSGRTGYTKALRFPQDYAEAASGAASATRLWLGSFDEINRLDDNSGGGSSSSLDYSTLFEESSISQTIADLVNQGDWYGIGESIANKLNESIENLNLHDMGARLGIKIRNAVSAALGFVENFDFSELGNELAEGINGLVGFIDWNKFGRLIGEGFNGAINFVAGYIEKIDVSGIAISFSGWINGFITSVDWEKTGRTIVEGFTKSIDFFAGLISGINWNSVATGLSDFLKGAIDKGIEWIKGKDWHTATVNLFDTIDGFVSNIDWGGIFGSMWELASTLVWTGLGALITGFGEVFIHLGERLSDNGFSAVGSILEGLGKGLSYFGKFIFNKGEETGDEFSNGLDSGLGGAFATAVYWIDKIYKYICTGIDYISAKLETFEGATINDKMTGKGGSSIGTIGTAIGEKVNSTIDKLKITTKATGGTVHAGDLFIANEAGPELVGRIGNKTSVANNDQIVSGIASGVADANSELISVVAAGFAAVSEAMRNNRGVTIDDLTKEITKRQGYRDRAYGI